MFISESIFLNLTQGNSWHDFGNTLYVGEPEDCAIWTFPVTLLQNPFPPLFCFVAAYKHCHSHFVLLCVDFFCGGLLTSVTFSSQKPITEEDVMKILPKKKAMYEALATAKVLSKKSTNSLGDWEVRWQYDPRVMEVEERYK